MTHLQVQQPQPAGPQMPAARVPRLHRRAAPSSERALLPLAVILVVSVLSYIASDLTVAVAAAVLYVGWKYLSREPEIRVVVVAFTYQWVQITIAVLYFATTGRRVVEMRYMDYRPMVLVALASISVLFAGFYFAAKFPKRKIPAPPIASNLPPKSMQLVVLYVTSVATSGIVEQLAWSIPALTQAVLVVSLVRYMLLFMLIRRLIKPKLRLGWIGLILIAEVAVGFSGFLANFREPIFIIAIALLSGFEKKKASHWILVASLAVTALSAAIAWTAIKPIIRHTFVRNASTADRMGAALSVLAPTLDQSAAGWKIQSDKLVSRMWTMYFPARALERVPSIVPHENGRILWSAVSNILFPRLFFPSKGILPSDSDKVRKYSGVWVAGREMGTSYAFGYVAESYVDFGIPLMFVPIFIYGLAAGAMHRKLRRSIRHPELRTAVMVVLFWLSLYLFEVSWVIMIGWAVTRFVILGAGTFAVDRYVMRRFRPRMRRATPRVAYARASLPEAQ